MSFKKIAWGTAMMSSVRVFRLVSQFVAIPILARLLSPEEYGLVAIAMPFAMFAMMIADAGIGMSLVRTPASERGVWSTCFWLSTILGAGLAALMALASPLVASLFNQPQLAPMLIALALVVLAQSVHLIPVTALQQAHRFKAIALVEVLSTVSGIGIALYMAYHHYGAWALIGQQVAIFTVKVTFICALSPFRPLMKFDWHEVREHVLFGRNVLGNTLVNYVGRSADNWIVGKVLGATLVGFYSMAFLFARLPQQIVSGPLQFVMYPQLAKMKDSPSGIASVFLLMTRLLAILIFPAMGMVAAAHAPIFSTLLSEKWMQAGVIFSILAAACGVQAVLSISETVMYSLNRTDIQLRTSTEYTVLWIVVLAFTVSTGITATAIAFCGLTLLYQLRYLALMLPLINTSMRTYFSTYLIPLVATAIGIALYSVAETMLSMADWQATILAGAIAFAAITGCALIQKKALMEGIRSWSHTPDGDAPIDSLEAGIELEP
jgi:O-antigen/teichoic acid export membrane protein